VAYTALITVTVAGLLGTTWAAKRSDAPADAQRPANDVVAQLEERVARLEERIAELEARHVVPGPVPANWLTPAPQFAPMPGEHETNGVKFRLYLLSGENAGTKFVR